SSSTILRCAPSSSVRVGMSNIAATCSTWACTPARTRICASTSSPYTVRNSGDRADRKSTRLNSSHVKISYAVFCLKKKRIPAEVCARRDVVDADIGDRHENDKLLGPQNAQNMIEKRPNKDIVTSL